jgi:hypothetical protein
MLVLPAISALRCEPRGVEAQREPCDAYAPDRQPLFGETHTHTRLSFDAVILDTRTGPRDAYAFAQGAPIGLPPYDAQGNALRTTRLRRLLDWAVVTDHAEYFGETQICTDPDLDPAAFATASCQGLREAVGSSPDTGIPQGFLNFGAALIFPGAPRNPNICGPDGTGCFSEVASVWLEIQAAAEEAYDRSARCAFTSFVAYEWTANTMQSNLHRNVIFRNEVVPALPTSYFEARTPAELYDALESDCLVGLEDCDFLAIPHNPNLSQPPLQMFDVAANTAEENARRRLFEPLVEIQQHKGESECRIGLGANDELCDHEKMDRVGVLGVPDPDQEFPPLGFVRNGLLEGLAAEDASGENPLAFGFVGGTDTHASIPGKTDEDDYPGHLGSAESLPRFRLNPDGQAPAGLDAGPGALAVVWAEENARDSIWRALERRETYATSGTRPIVRVFGGFWLPPDMCQTGSFVRHGYNRGVPMGGDLGRSVDPARPLQIAVLAHQDLGTPGSPGTPLQRVQMVKGWVDAAGAKQQAVYDVAGDPQNGAGVDPATCTPQGAGFESLCTLWEDPDFDPDLDAFYYARVVENPTCRWSSWECLRAEVTCDGETPTSSNLPDTDLAELVGCCDPDVPKTVQERAWTSPIWYHAEP